MTKMTLLLAAHTLGLCLLPHVQGTLLPEGISPQQHQQHPKLVAASSNASCASIGCFAHFHKGDPCGCTEACYHYNDCCSDFATLCGNATHPSPSPRPPSGPTGGPEQLHLALTSDSPHQYVVSFATSAHYTQKPSCAAGASSKTYSKTFTGLTHTYTSGNWHGLLHTVVLDVTTIAAAPGRVYYSCDGGKTEYSFPLVAPSHFPLTVGVVADLGEDCNRPGCGNSTITALIREVDAGNVSLLVHAGDIAYTGGQQAVWDEFMREMEPAAARVPYMVCVGNHEHYFNFSGYLNRFAMPAGSSPVSGPISPSKATTIDLALSGVAAQAEPAPAPPTTMLPTQLYTQYYHNLWHSYNHGGVHFLAYSTEHNLTMQLPFIEADLAAAAANRAAVPWIVVYGHRPIYCSTDDYYDCNVKGPKELGPALEPLLKKYGVDLYLAGHLHNYERSFPTLNGTRTESSYNKPNATVHVVVGMAGNIEGLTYSWESPQPNWSARRLTALGYAKLHFLNASTMVFDYLYSANGTVADSFTITK